MTWVHIHFHMLCLDGAYTLENGRLRFRRKPQRTRGHAGGDPRHLERRGLLVRDLESSHLNRVPGEDNALEILQGHSITPRGRMRYTLKTPCRNGTTPVVFAPLDFISRSRAKITPAGRGAL